MRNRRLKVVGCGLGLVMGILLVAGPVPEAGAVTVIPTITAVKFTGTYANPVVTITGKGFGTVPLGVLAPCSGNGKDFESNRLYLEDFSNSLGTWAAGQPRDCIGLVVSTYSNTTIKMKFGSFYYFPGTNQKLFSLDHYRVGVRGAIHGGYVHYT